jgi:O-antigen/teichoic acid export membrane protein
VLEFVLPSSNNPPGETKRPPLETPLAFRVVRGGAAVAFGSYFLFAFGFLSNLVLTRLLAPADFGIFALGTFFFALFNLRPKFGVDQAFAHHAVTDAQSSGTFAGLSITTGIASLLLTCIAAPVLVAFGYSQSVIVVTLALAGVGMMDSVMGIAWVQLDKALLFTRVSLVTALAFPISYVPAFYIAYHGGGYWALLAQNIAYSFLLLVGLWFTARRALPEIWQVRWDFSRALAKQFLRFGMFVGLATIFATLVYQFDNFLVGTFVGVETLGYYDRAYRIAQWSSILVGSVLTRTAFYAYSRLQNDPVRLTKTAMMSLWIVTTLALPIALAVFVSADDLVLFLFGEKWLPSALLLKFLVAYSILRPLMDDASSLFIALGHPRRTTLVVVFQALALVAAATPLTFQFGAVGTAIGVGLAFVVGLIVTYYFVRRTLPQLSLRDAFVMPLIAAAITILIALAVALWIRTLSTSLVIVLAAKIGLTLLLYWGVTFLLRPHVTLERVRYVWRLFRQREPFGTTGS